MVQDAIRHERYSEASGLQAAIVSLDAQDAVASAQRQLTGALAEERYNDAADLRDSGLTGLQGWWAGQAEDDPVGHIMHITPEYSRCGLLICFYLVPWVGSLLGESPGTCVLSLIMTVSNLAGFVSLVIASARLCRWTGRIYRPKDLAMMKVSKAELQGGGSRTLRSSTLPLQGPKNPSSSSSSSSSGSPILEVFVRPQAASGPGAQKYLHQAVSLRLPTMEEVRLGGPR